VPTTDVAPVAERKFEPAHAPAVPLNVVPVPRPKITFTPTLTVAPTQVPVVSPGIVTDFCSQVLAAEIV
jgi:hypothetical protein